MKRKRPPGDDPRQQFTIRIETQTQFENQPDARTCYSWALYNAIQEKMELEGITTECPFTPEDLHNATSNKNQEGESLPGAVNAEGASDICRYAGEKLSESGIPLYIDGVDSLEALEEGILNGDTAIVHLSEYDHEVSIIGYGNEGEMIVHDSLGLLRNDGLPFTITTIAELMENVDLMKGGRARLISTKKIFSVKEGGRLGLSKPKASSLVQIKGTRKL